MQGGITSRTPASAVFGPGTSALASCRSKVAVNHCVVKPGGGQAFYYANETGGQIHRVIGPAAVSPGSQFFTLTPCRLIDTRGATGTYGGPALAGGAPTVEIARQVSVAGL